MPALCDAGIVTRDVSCHLFCIPPGAQLWIQIQLLAQIAGISGDPQALSHQVAAFNIPQGLNHQVQASLLCQIALNAGADVQCNARWLLDAARCANPSPNLAMTRQTEAFCTLAQCDESALTAMSRCSHCIPNGLQERVKTFLLATIAGGSMDADTLVNDSVYLAGVPPGLFPMIEGTLAGLWSGASVYPCGTPSNMIEITGAGNPNFNSTYALVGGLYWLSTYDDGSGGYYRLYPPGSIDPLVWCMTYVLFGPPTVYYRSTDATPCHWVTDPVWGTDPPPTGQYITPLETLPAAPNVTWVDSGGPHVGTLATFNASADAGTVSSIDLSGNGVNSVTGIENFPVAANIDLTNNNLSSANVDAILCALDATGHIGGTINTSGQTPPAIPSAIGIACAASLIIKGWTVIYDMLSTVIMDDGTGTFWQLVVDTLGNVGTISSAGPATADVILDDGGGGFWKLIVDTLGNRGATTDPGPATTAPIIDDGTGTFWTIHVDTGGNIYATS